MVVNVRVSRPFILLKKNYKQTISKPHSMLAKLGTSQDIVATFMSFPCVGNKTNHETQWSVTQHSNHTVSYKTRRLELYKSEGGGRLLNFARLSAF